MCGSCFANLPQHSANPVSMEASLRTTSQMVGQAGFALILGDMLELGEGAPKYHYELGKKAAELRARALVAIGEYAEHTASGARDAGIGDAKAAPDGKAAIDAMLANECGNLAGVRTILVKGSRGMALEQVIADLVTRLNALSSPLLTK